MHELLDQLYRAHTARMTAALTRALGPANLEVVESAIQDAFIKAMHEWPEKGVPDRPPAWLFTVARNRPLDMVRRDARWVGKRGTLEHEPGPDEPDPALGDIDVFRWAVDRGFGRRGAHIGSVGDQPQAFRNDMLRFHASALR